MRLSPRLFVLLPVVGALLLVGQIQSHNSYAQNPVASPDPLRHLPLPPSQSGSGQGTLGGPIQSKPFATPIAAKPKPTFVAVKPTAIPFSIATPKNAIRVGISTVGGPLQLWAPKGAVVRDLDQPNRVQNVAANSTLVFDAGPLKTQKIGARTFTGKLTIGVGGNISTSWSRIAVVPLGNEFPRATSNGKAARYGRPYRGTFEVFAQRSPEPNHRKGALALINVVGLEDYLKGVVPWEMSPSAPSEALKAQAICARTKTLDFKTSGRFQAGGFDVCDYDACQGYPGTENEKPTTTQAVEATKGIALFYGGRPIDAVYSTNSGGVTASARDVWRGDVPYLQSVHDFSSDSPLSNLFRGAMNEGKWAQFVSKPFASFARPDGVAQTRYEARKYRWTQFVSVEEASKAFTLQGIARVTNIEVETRASSGRARRVKVSGIDAKTLAQISAQGAQVQPKLILPGKAGEPRDIDHNEFSPVDYGSVIIPPKTVVLESDGPIRAMFSKRLGSTTALPSSLFVITPQTDAGGQVTGWNFAGAGWGHGVGMCQRGAQNHALSGWDARRILNHYYRGVEIRAVN